MKVIAYGESYECTKAEKGTTYIQLYNGEEKDVLFAGISDFSGYSIEGGEWSAPTPTEGEVLRADVDYLLMMQEG